MERLNVTGALFLGLSALALSATGAAPVAADDAPACTPASTATPSPADGFLQAAAIETGEIGALATCTADCWDGSSVTCDEGSNCSAQDSVCSSGIRGYCEDSSGRTNCPTCPDSICTASTLCGEGPASAIDCDGTDYCNKADGCWVHCDGQTTWCPDADPFTCPAVH